MASDTAVKSIAVVTGSTRPDRVGGIMAAHVLDVLKTVPLPPNTVLTPLDLGEAPASNLPLLDEPVMAQAHPADDPTPHYKQAHSRAWSAEVRKHTAFIFVTAQYNWGVPGALKNALDFLFHEWAGRPGMVVAYGGRGGTLAGPALVQVLRGLHMNHVETFVPYKIDVRKGQHGFGPEREAIWKEEGSDEKLKEVFAELLKKMEPEDPKA